MSGSWTQSKFPAPLRLDRSSYASSLLIRRLLSIYRATHIASKASQAAPVTTNMDDRGDDDDDVDEAAVIYLSIMMRERIIDLD